MRPRKVILLVDADKQRLSQNCLLLDVRGYKVLRAPTRKVAMEILSSRSGFSRVCPPTSAIDLLVVQIRIGTADGNQLVRETKGMHPDLPCLLIGPGAADRSMLAADAFLPGEFGAAELIEQIKLLLARKRGPKGRAIDVAALASAAGAVERAAVVRPEVAA